jgi:hypothetical protein
VTPTPALSPAGFLASVRATRDTLGQVPLKLLDVVDRVAELTDGSPYAIVGGLAQMLWSRKSHTDDLDVALTSTALRAAYQRVVGGAAQPGWATPAQPDRAHEQNDVLEVYHLLYEGVVVDLISFENRELTHEIIATSVDVPELGGLRFVRPELLLVTQLLRPGPRGALAAVDLIVARQERGDLDEPMVRAWANRLGKEPQLDRALAVASALTSSS